MPLTHARRPSPSLAAAWLAAGLLVPTFPALAVPRAAVPRPAEPALADTGVFAPVAAQFRARESGLRTPAGSAVTPARLRLLLSAGRVDDAAQQAPAASGEAREVAVARGRVALLRQDFDALAGIVDRLDPTASATPAERWLRYDWLYARDDAAAIDTLTRAAVAGRDDAHALPELLAAGRLAYDMLDYPRAESLDTRALAQLPAAADDSAGVTGPSQFRAAALTGLGLIKQKRRDWDGSLTVLCQALAASANPTTLLALSETLVRIGRTDEAITAAQWGVRLNPYHEAAHYWLGNGYARRNYTQLFAARAAAFADAAGQRGLHRADAWLASGARALARAAYAGAIAAHPGWADARVRLASLDFEDGRLVASRQGCFAALRLCPEYGRAHAVLAKALEAQRATVDVHRTGYETRFAAAALPAVPGIERFVTNWRSLSPRHQKRVALSVAPWRAFIPVLLDGGATLYIKPLYLRLSECPDLGTLRDQRIGYDSRLWDDVRGCGGYHTVTGIEDVERTIFDRYNTVLHELTHQVHGVMTPDDARAIQEHYRLAKARDDSTREGYLSRYAGGSVYEYFAEGANAFASPMRDAYDPREIVRERLDQRDPDLRHLVEGFLARTDVGASYPIAYAAGGDDRVERGRVNEALPFYHKALTRSPADETALTSLARALVLGHRAAAAESVALRAVEAHPTSGSTRVVLAEASWHAGRGLAPAAAALAAARDSVRREDRYLVDIELGRLAWNAGEATRARAAYDSVLAYQSDSPEGLHGRALSLALAGQADSAFVRFDQAVRVRTGEVGLRCDYAHALLAAGRVAPARAQLDEARLLDEQNPEAEALRAWADLAQGRLDAARRHAQRALAWGPWCDLAHIVAGGIEARGGRKEAARAAWAPVVARIERGSPPDYVYRPAIASWEEVHALPSSERRLLESFQGEAR